MGFPVKTPEQQENGIRAQIKRRRKGFVGFVVVHTIRDEYICAATREDCERQALAMWGDGSRGRWYWLEVRPSADREAVARTAELGQERT